MKSHHKSTVTVIALIIFAALSSSASATTRECYFTPSRVTINNAGGVFLDGTTGTTPLWAQLVCNVNSTYNNISPDVCKTWVSVGLTAQASGKTLYFLFDDNGDSTKTSCTTWPAWGAPTILYFGVTN